MVRFPRSLGGLGTNNYHSVPVSSFDDAASTAAYFGGSISLLDVAASTVHSFACRPRSLHGVGLGYLCIVVCPHFLSSASFRAYIGAARQGLARFELPVIGHLADRWVSEE